MISQAIIIEGLNYLALKKAIDSLKEEHSLIENEKLIVNYYNCQHILTKQDLLGQ